MIRYVLLSMFALIFTSAANAKKGKTDEGVMVELKVTDTTTKNIVPTATIRYYSDDSYCEVNELTGIWRATEVFLADGSVRVFTPGTTLQLEVSAPRCAV